MNGLCGILRLDNQPIYLDQLTKCVFNSPLWQPDHQEVWLQNNLGLACTQRFITPECPNTTLPLQDKASGCVLATDAYLTNRPELMSALAIADPHTSDSALILAAYLKWGFNCAAQLQGSFFFVLWDPSLQALYVATDHSGLHPCLYSYKPGQYFIFANYMVPFRVLCSKLTVNEFFTLHYALDSRPFEETCYQEVNRLLPAHQLILTPKGLSQNPYWHLEEKDLPYRTREEYYEAFRTLFTQTVQRHMRTNYPITTHISGGLDSSSIAAVAAKCLLAKNKPLYGFTAVPRGLDGQSVFRKTFQYHDLPRIEPLLEQYPNISHFIYQSSPQHDIYQTLSTFYPFIDQPIRNVFNLDWILGCLDYALAQGSRIELNGQMGNATISWTGRSLKSLLHALYLRIKKVLPQGAMDLNYSYNNPYFLSTTQGKKIIRHCTFPVFNYHHFFVRNPFLASMQTSIYPILLWYGIESLDPSQDIQIKEFCYNVPQWVFSKGRGSLKKRLLIREGLTGIVPEAIRLNPYRGEQAADAYLQYNTHRNHWQEKMHNILAKPEHAVLAQCYNQEKLMHLFKKYNPIETLTKSVLLDIHCHLARFLSIGFFQDFLLQHS